MSGKAPQFPWAQWVFKDLQVRGFNLRRWMTNNKKKVRRAATRRARMATAAVQHACAQRPRTAAN